uniref:Uncharacterized protein n=1 Tax=Rhizophora mucronata TaxID=61149 RepID=A0A2P2P723_RHIMU
MVSGIYLEITIVGKCLIFPFRILEMLSLFEVFSFLFSCQF